MQADTLGPPSQFTKYNNWSTCLTDLYSKGVPIMRHRPFGTNSCAPPVSLYYTGFSKYLTDCSAIEMDHNDTSFTESFVLAMSNGFTKEKEREKVIKQLLGLCLVVIFSGEDTSLVPVDIAILFHRFYYQSEE